MPIDKAHKATDKQIEAMERHIDKIYREAENGVIQKAEAYFRQFDRLDKQKAEQVAKGLLSEEEYLKWRKNKMLYGKRFDNMKQQIAQELATVNETALAYINGELPKTYIANYNAVNEGIQNTVDGYSFELVDKNTVKKIATEGDKSLLPPPSQKTIAKLEKSLAEGKDIRWNTKKINAEVLQGVLQGESMDKIAKRMRNVTDMNKTSAIRNARTMVTGAENAGRMDMLHKATADGIQVQKEWIAAIDARTRHWHADLDGDLKDIDEPFVNDYGKIMFPADPTAHPANVYNCRCSLGYKVLGFAKRAVGKYQVEAAPQLVDVSRVQDGAEIDKLGRQSVYKNWEDYRQKFLGHAAEVDFDKLDTSWVYDNIKLGNYKDKETVGNILNTVDSLSSKFYSPLNKMVWMDKQESSLSTSFASSSHIWGAGAAEIRFNPLKLNEKGIKRIAELSQSGYSIKIPTGREIEYVATHEYAHCIFNMGEKLPTKAKNFVEGNYSAVVNARREIEPIWNAYAANISKLTSEYKEISKPLDYKLIMQGEAPTATERAALEKAGNALQDATISKYSLVNSDEFVAEAFTDAVMNENPSEYSKQVYDIIVKYFGKG